MNKEVLMELKGVQKHFPVRGGTLVAVGGVDLTIHKGETIGLVGESGCGKTTLGRTIVKLYKLNDGTITYKGRDIWSLNRKENLEYRKNVQIIYQDPYASLDPLSVVSDSIAEGLEIHKMCKTPKEKQEKVYELLNMVGLNKEHANRFPHEFSGGQRQRIGIARALAVQPELIVCDEPISALDVSIQAQVINLLNDLRDRLGLTIMFIAHDLSVVKYFSDRIGVMYFGKMVELASSDELFAHPLHPYTKSLLSAIPLPDPNSEKQRTRIVYNSLAAHDYSVDKPTMREVAPGHFVYCNDAEERKYKEELAL